AIDERTGLAVGQRRGDRGVDVRSDAERSVRRAPSVGAVGQRHARSVPWDDELTLQARSDLGFLERADRDATDGQAGKRAVHVPRRRRSGARERDRDDDEGREDELPDEAALTTDRLLAASRK